MSRIYVNISKDRMTAIDAVAQKEKTSREIVAERLLGEAVDRTGKPAKRSATTTGSAKKEGGSS